MKPSKEFKPIIDLFTSGSKDNITLAIELTKSQGFQNEFQKMFLRSLDEGSEFLKSWIYDKMNAYWIFADKIAPIFQFCKELKRLELQSAYDDVIIIPDFIKNINITHLIIERFKISGIDNIAGIPTLVEFVGHRCKLSQIPECFQNVSNKLQEIDLRMNQIKDANPLFLNPNIDRLLLEDNPIKSIPKAPTSSNLSTLSITITNKNLRSFKKNISSYKSLEDVNVYSNQKIADKIMRWENKNPLNFRLTYFVETTNPNKLSSIDYASVFALSVILVIFFSALFLIIYMMLALFFGWEPY